MHKFNETTLAFSDIQGFCGINPIFQIIPFLDNHKVIVLASNEQLHLVIIFKKTHLLSEDLFNHTY